MVARRRGNRMTAPPAHRPRRRTLTTRDSIIVSGEHHLIVRPTRNLAGSRYPDLLAAFESSNGYIVEEQGKPPDFVLEIASERTGRVDVGRKREDYERLQIPEYWRFDETETGRRHGARLGGDILKDTARGKETPSPRAAKGTSQSAPATACADGRRRAQRPTAASA